MSSEAAANDCDVLILGASFAGLEVHRRLRRNSAGRATARGYLAVSPTLQCRPDSATSVQRIFACGDAARIVAQDGEWPTMQRAIECLWQAKVVGQNLLALAAARSEHSLRAHTLRRDFPYGVSVGAASMIVYGRLVIELGALGVWFRRFLMRQYFRRYGNG